MVFNTALKFDFNNAHLHFLNALAYHQGYVRGEADNFALAKTGYYTALLQDPSMEGIAYLQIGRLSLDAKDHAAAKQAFAMAVDANHQSTDALYGLAQAAAFDGDLATSYWAASELERLKWGSPLLYRVKAIHAALAQQPERARILVADYAKSTDDRGDAKYLQGRVDQLLAIKTSLRDGGSSQSSEDGSGPILLAQMPASSTPNPAAQPQGTSSAEAPPQDASPDVNQPAQIKKWFRCDNMPGIPRTWEDSGGQQPSNDESMTIPPLPAPCPGEVPRMAIIEVTMVGTQETKGKNLGINLLDGLTGIFTLQRARTFTKSTNVTEEVVTNNLAFANTVANSVDVLRYSLNIANAAYTKNEVIARPTLAAIDRVPAVFFSGATITLGITGVGGGSSTVVDKPIGVSLTVTPTFIDDENLLVSMRATRSNIENNLVSISSSVLLQQTRNTINASAKLKFGETFVLGGLMIKQDAVAQSGTPILQDIPVLQYLFKRSQKVDVTSQMLTLITIRRPPDIEAETKKAKTTSSTHKLSAVVNDYVKLQAIPPVIDVILARLKVDHPQFRQLREKDLMPENASSKSKLQSILNDFKEMIYY